MTVEYYQSEFVYSARTIPAHVTVRHFQLKNLICRDSSEANETHILFCCRHSIRSLNPKTNQTTSLSSKFSFEPRSLASAQGYTVAGGENGNLVVIDKEFHKTEHEIGGSLVNGIDIYPGFDSQDRAVISNNDASLKIFNLSSMQTESSINCPMAMNHASVSPDGKMMAAVGDGTEVYLFVNESGHWRRYVDVCIAEDACFSSVFSPSQKHLAIGSQDGTCTILDLRMIPTRTRDNTAHRGLIQSSKQGKYLHKARSVNSCPRGSVRTVSWSPSPLDMLVFTESATFATVLDCRDFSRVQRLRIPGGVSGPDREISGATWSSRGEQLYIGSEEGITEFHVQTNLRRQFPSFSIR